MTTRFFKVYGKSGHRQRESFNYSSEFTCYSGETIAVLNSNITGTNLYTLLRITAESEEACMEALKGQISDGIFENSAVGYVGEIKEADFMEIFNRQKLYLDEYLNEILTEKELKKEYKSKIKDGTLDLEEYPSFGCWLYNCLNYSCALSEFN